jgi:hypothetical protein
MSDTADILRAAADIVEQSSSDNPLTQIWPITAITQAAPNTDAAHQALQTLAGHLHYDRHHNPVRDVRRWSQMRTPAEIAVQMRAAADAAERGA